MGDRNEYMREYMREYRAAKKAAAAAGGDVNSGPAPASLRAARVKKIAREGNTEEYTEHMHAGAAIGWLIAGVIVLGVLAFAAWRIRNAPPLTDDELARISHVQTWLDNNRGPAAADTTEPAPITTEQGQDDTTEGDTPEENTEPGQE